MVKVLTLAALIALAACTHTRGSFCQIADPIRLSDTAIAAMTDAEVERALVHNETGKRLCGWKP